MRERINQILNTKAFLIVFSIVASIALWTYVAYVENPEISKTIADIPISYTGVESLAEKDLVVTDANIDRVTIRFRGKRNIISKLDSDNLSVTVDLAKGITGFAGSSGVYQLQYTINYPENINPNDVSIDNASHGYVTITVGKLATREIPVTGMYNISVAEGYLAEQAEVSAETIIVSGAESVVSSISYASFTIEREEITKTVEAEALLTLIDADGKEIPTTNLTLSQDSVIVRIPVIITKDIALTVNFNYGASAAPQNVKYTITPESVKLAGDAGTLDEINQIVLGTIDLREFALSNTYNLKIVIPNSTENLSGETEAAVVVQIVGLETKKLSASNISIRGDSENMTTTIITQSLDITLRGPAELLDEVTAENVRIVGDLSEIGNTKGTFSVTARVYIDGYTTIDAIGEYKITVQIE